MPAPLMRVEGARQLRASMKAAGADLSDLTAVNKATAGLVSAEASGRAPRRTGTLASTVRPAGTRTAAIVRAGRASVPYAPVVHYGWPGRGIEPQPFVFTAAQDKEQEWTGYYEAETAKIVDRVHGV